MVPAVLRFFINEQNLHRFLYRFRVMVMSQGQILEMDKPSNLLENSNSAFYKMAKDAKLL